jgi:hypothetical protein
MNVSWADSEAHDTYAQLPGYRELQRWASNYPRRTDPVIGCLTLQRRLAFQTICFVFDVAGEAPLENRLSALVRDGTLKTFVAKDANYARSWKSENGRIIVQSGMRWKNRRNARFYVSDLAKANDLRRVFRKIVRHTSASNLALSRFDANFEFEESLEDFDLIPRLVRKHHRSSHEAALEQAYGDGPAFKYYSTESGTRVEFRFGEWWKQGKFRGGLCPSDLVCFPNPFEDIRQLDLRPIGALGSIRDSIVTARRAGGKILLASGTHPNLRGRRDRKGRAHPSRLEVLHDSNRPDRLWNRQFRQAVRELARALGVPASYFGLTDE